MEVKVKKSHRHHHGRGQARVTTSILIFIFFFIFFLRALFKWMEKSQEMVTGPDKFRLCVIHCYGEGNHAITAISSPVMRAPDSRQTVTQFKNIYFRYRS